MAQSDELTAFYQEYKAWLDAGAPVEGSNNPHDFLRGVGLCANLRYFCHSHGCFGGYVHFADEMTSQFIEAGLHCRTPFNVSISDVYVETETNKAYRNKKRIKWVEDHCSA